MRSDEGARVRHVGGGLGRGAPQPHRPSRHDPRRLDCGQRLRSFFFHPAQQFLAHDNVEPRLLIAIEYSAHFEDVCDGLALCLAHRVMKAINCSGETFALRVVFTYCGRDIACGGAEFNVKRGPARRVAGFNSLQPLVLLRCEINFAMHSRIERVAMSDRAHEIGPDEDAAQPRAEPNECGQTERLPSLQHRLSAKRRSGRVGLIERERTSVRSGRRRGRGYADRRADHKDKRADPGKSAVGDRGGRAIVNAGPDFALKPIHSRANVDPAQSRKLAIKVSQGRLQRSCLLIRAPRRAPLRQLAHRIAAEQG